MDPINYILMYVGVIVQILLSLKSVIIEKKFDLNFWWKKNKWATLITIAVITSTALILNITSGTDINLVINTLTPIVIGYITNSVAFHTLREKSK